MTAHNSSLRVAHRPPRPVRPTASSSGSRPECFAGGDRVVLDRHVATVQASGVLHHGPDKFAVSTVNALAAHLCAFTVNSWHL